MEHATLTYTPQFYEQAYFNELWLLASPGGKLPLSEERARQFLAKSGLKQQIVEQIWSLATPRSTMDRAQFNTALRLVTLAQCVKTIQPGMFHLLSHVVMALPSFPEIKEPPMQFFSFELTPSDLQQFTQFFRESYPKGSVSCTMFRQTLKPLKLPADVVQKICTWADRDRDNALNCDEFCVAMHLATCIANRGHPVPDDLPDALLQFLQLRSQPAPSLLPPTPRPELKPEADLEPERKPRSEPATVPNSRVQPPRREESKQADTDLTRRARLCFLSFATDRARRCTDYSGCRKYITAVKQDARLAEVCTKIRDFTGGEKGFVTAILRDDGSVYWTDISEQLQLPSEELSLNRAELTDLFCRCAGGQEAALSSNQLSAMFQTVAVPLQGNELALMMMELDADDNGSIELEELTQALLDTSFTVAHPKITELAEASRAAKVCEAKEILKMLFDLYDEDRSGSLEYEELQTMIRDIGLPLDDAQLFQFLSGLDTDGSCLIELDEFVAAAEADWNENVFDTAHLIVQSMRELRKEHIRVTVETLFRHYDDNGNDGLEYPEVQAMLEGSGMQVSRENLTRLMKELGNNGNVGRDQFVIAATDRSKPFTYEQINRLIRHNTDMDTLKRPLRIWFNAQNDLTQSLTTHEQRRLLMAIFEEGGGRGWWFKAGWGSNQPVNQWYGVTCGPDGMVTRLCIASGLRGHLSSAIGGLLYLKELRLSDVSLSGTIPEELSRLMYLEEVHLDRNRLTGPVSSTLHRARKLRELCLNNNRLTGMLPQSLTLMTELRVLRLQNNSFSGGFEVIGGWARSKGVDAAL